MNLTPSTFVDYHLYEVCTNILSEEQDIEKMFNLPEDAKITGRHVTISRIICDKLYAVHMNVISPLNENGTGPGCIKLLLLDNAAKLTKHDLYMSAKEFSLNIFLRAMTPLVLKHITLKVELSYTINETETTAKKYIYYNKDLLTEITSSS